MKFTEKKLSSEVRYDGRILRLEVDEVELPDKSKSLRECIRHCGGAAVVFVKDGKLCLVNQYRYLYGSEISELPAGKVDEGEASERAALRELEEETGYRAEKAELLLKIYPSPGYTDEVIDIFFVESARFVGNKPDEGEFLDCSFVDLNEVLAKIESGEMRDAKTVAGVYAYLRKYGE